MKKVRYLAGLAGLAPAAMIGPAAYAAPAAPAGHDAAAATSTKAVSLNHLRAQRVAVDTAYSCFDLDSGVYGWCNAPLISSTLLINSKGFAELAMFKSNRVKVTCWYKSSRGNIQDHVVREDVSGREHHLRGHVSDLFVNFSDQNPSVVGLAHC
jgi:hypothetical protein